MCSSTLAVHCAPSCAPTVSQVIQLLQNQALVMQKSHWMLLQPRHVVEYFMEILILLVKANHSSVLTWIKMEHVDIYL